MFGDKRILAVIPARGGSKRIPKKNIYPLFDKPMMQWTIEAANKSAYLDTVLVSTDSAEIQDCARNLGAEAPFLRNQAADDHSPVSEATLSALNQAEEFWGNFDVVIQLMPNCPLREAKDIDEAIEAFFLNKREAQISFFKYGWMNPWWAHKVQDGRPKPVFKEALQSRSQDLEELFCPTGSIWISTVASLKQHHSFYAPGYEAFVLDWVAALDIDDMDDLLMAEALFLMKDRTG